MSSTQHTEGRLSAAHWHDDEAELEGWTLVVGKHRLPLCSAECEDPAEAEANARRLIACWNACQTFKTEDLEKESYIGKLILTACDAIHDVEAEKAAARMQALVDALAATETYLQERLAATNGTGATKILPMIRAALAGAQVAPTQSTWADC